jgi:hypothetical protein
VLGVNEVIPGVGDLATEPGEGAEGPKSEIPGKSGQSGVSGNEGLSKQTKISSQPPEKGLVGKERQVEPPRLLGTPTKPFESRSTPKSKNATEKRSALEQLLGGHVRTALAYCGNTFADPDTYNWQNGLSLWSAWITDAGWYGGVGYLLVLDQIHPSTQTEDEPELSLEIERHPIEAFLGKRYRNGRFSAYGELVGVFDLMSRRVDKFDNELATKTPNNTKLSFGLALRGIVEYSVIGDIGVFVGFAIEDYLRYFDYVYKPENELPNTTTSATQSNTTSEPSNIPLLKPRKYRADLQVGLSFYL